MKHSVIFISMLILAVAGFAQSKKELNAMIVQKDAQIQELEKTTEELRKNNSHLLTIIPCKKAFFFKMP